MNLPDLGRVPAARDFDSVDLLSFLAKEHNSVLKNNIENLKVKYPDVTWFYFDAYWALNQVMDYPQMYGFSNVTETCYESVMDELKAPTMLNISQKLNPFTGKDVCDGFYFLIRSTLLS